jgi:hypothetical protein
LGKCRSAEQNSSGNAEGDIGDELGHERVFLPANLLMKLFSHQLDKIRLKFMLCLFVPWS